MAAALVLPLGTHACSCLCRLTVGFAGNTEAILPQNAILREQQSAGSPEQMYLL